MENNVKNNSVRPGGRALDQLRLLTVQRGYLPHPVGCALISLGNTKVLCTVTRDLGVPAFLKGKKRGWLTAEYVMIPGATHIRTPRTDRQGNPHQRSIEISRFIGRALRSCLNLADIGECTLHLDCEVLQADGGTRTAAVTGSFIALRLAVQKMLKVRIINANPIHGRLAAISTGIYRGQPLLDLEYREDKDAESDINFVMNDGGNIIEVQGTAEGHAISRREFGQMLELAWKGIQEIIHTHMP